MACPSSVKETVPVAPAARLTEHVELSPTYNVEGEQTKVPWLPLEAGHAEVSTWNDVFGPVTVIGPKLPLISWKTICDPFAFAQTPLVQSLGHADAGYEENSAPNAEAMEAGVEYCQYVTL